MSKTLTTMKKKLREKTSFSWHIIAVSSIKISLHWSESISLFSDMFSPCIYNPVNWFLVILSIWYGYLFKLFPLVLHKWFCNVFNSHKTQSKNLLCSFKNKGGSNFKCVFLKIKKNIIRFSWNKATIWYLRYDHNPMMSLKPMLWNK